MSRFLPYATGAASPLCALRSRQEARHSFATSSSAAMCRRQSLRFVSSTHRRFPHTTTVGSASVQGFAMHRSCIRCRQRAAACDGHGSLSHRAGVLVSARGGAQVMVVCGGLCRGRAHASLLHNAPFWKVSPSHYAKASFCGCHRFAPFGFPKNGVMQSALPCVGVQPAGHALRSRVRALPARVPQASRVVCQHFFTVSVLRTGGRFALVLPPRPPLGLALRAYSLCRLVARPPPPRGGLPPPGGGVPLRRARCALHSFGACRVA